jgi:hypothetical protein
MGMAKRLFEERWERGWDSVNKFVCGDCFNDQALQDVVGNKAEEKHCDYCGQESDDVIAAPVDAILEVIGESIRTEYGNPDDEGVPYETAEGGYQGETLSTGEVLEEVGDPFENDQLRDDVLTAFNDSGLWCQKHFWQLPKAEALRYGWAHFCKLVKYRARYVFLVAPDGSEGNHDPDHITPARFLEEFADIVQDSGLIQDHPAGSGWWRARWVEPAKKVMLPGDLSPPPLKYAKNANRMSPAGIPMFYGSTNKDTAAAETLNKNEPTKEEVVQGQFQTARTFKVLDLRNPPPAPSIFDEARRHLRAGLKFLRHFVRDLSAPIEKDGREHIEYVPTQIVTEYFRHVYKTPEGEPVQGILFMSAREHGGENCVLFFENEDCCSIHEGWTSETKPYPKDEPAYWLGLDEKSVSRMNPNAKKTAKAAPSPPVKKAPASKAKPKGETK